MRPSPPLRPAEALEMLGGGFDPEVVGPLSGCPVLAVAVGADEESVECGRILARLPCLGLAVDRDGTQPAGLDGFDILLTAARDPERPWVPGDVDETTAAVLDAAEQWPQASVALAQLLRLGRELDLEAALVAESITYGLLQAGPEHARWLGSRRPMAPKTDPEPPVLVEREADRLRVRLNRPAVHNAYSAAMRDELVAAMTLAATDPTIEEIELSGNGPSFCSGGDLAEFGTAPDPVTAHLVRTTRSAARWMSACSPRLTARVHGPCVGAGMELSALARRVRAEPGSRFRLPEVSMGLVPGAGGTASIPRRIGRHRFAYLAVTGTELDATTALAWALVDEVVTAGGAGPNRDRT